MKGIKLRAYRRARHGTYLHDSKSPAMKIRLYKYLTLEGLAAFVKFHSIKLSFGHETNDKYEMLSGALNPTADTAKREQESKAVDKHGFVSLSKRYDDPYMWGSYADKHMGACIEFEFDVDVEDELGRGKETSYCRKEKPKPRYKGIRDIDNSYFDGRKIVPCQYETNRIDKIHTSLPRCTQNIISNKHLGWGWEDECRVIYSTYEGNGRRSHLVQSVCAGKTILYTTKDLNHNIIGIYLSPLCPVSVTDVKNGIQEDESLAGVFVQRLRFLAGTYATAPCYVADNKRFIEALGYIRAGDADALEKLLKSHSILCAEHDENRATLLMHAARNDDAGKILQLLLKHSNVNAVDSEGRTALMYAARRGAKVALALLLKQKADRNIFDDRGNTALDYSYYRYDIESVRILINGQANIKLKYNSDKLIWAAKTGMRDFLALLLPHVKDIAATDETGRNALMWASRNAEAACVKLILDYLRQGAIVPPSRFNVINEASIEKRRETILRKIIMQRDYEGRTALMLAAWGKSIEIARELIACGADVNASDYQNSTSLIMAAWGELPNDQADAELIKLLIDSGADVSVQENTGYTALSYATYHGRWRCIRALLDSPNGQSAQLLLGRGISGETAIMHATKGSSARCLELMLDVLKARCPKTYYKRRVLGQRDGMGKGLLWHSYMNGNAAAVELLEAEGVSFDRLCGLRFFEDALTGALRYNSPELLQRLIQWRRKKEHKFVVDADKISPALIDAARDGNKQCIKLVLKNRKYLVAALGGQDNGGCNLFMWSVYKDSDDLVKLLLQYLPEDEVMKRDCSGCNALIWAARKGSAKCVDVILSHVRSKMGRDASRRFLLAGDINGMTPLMWAAWKGNSNSVKALLKKNADILPQIEKKDNNGFTVLDWAVVGRNEKCVRLLLDNGAKFGRTLEGE